MKLSLVIPTRRQAEIKKCLDTIKKHTQDYEVVIIEGDDGFATKLNRGVEASNGEYIILLHDDAEVTPGWADELADCGTFCLGEHNDSFDCWGGYYSPQRYCTDPKETPEYSYWLCLHRKVIDTIGKFDERFIDPDCQDVDMGLQLKKHGYSIKCLPGKIIHRCAEGSGTPNERQKAYLERKWDVN